MQSLPCFDVAVTQAPAVGVILVALLQIYSKNLTTRYLGPCSKPAWKPHEAGANRI